MLQGISLWLQAVQAILPLFYGFAQIVGFDFPLKNESLTTAGYRTPASDLEKTVFMFLSAMLLFFPSKF